MNRSTAHLGLGPGTYRYLYVVADAIHHALINSIHRARLADSTRMRLHSQHCVPAHVEAERHLSEANHRRGAKSTLVKRVQPYELAAPMLLLHRGRVLDHDQREVVVRSHCEPPPHPLSRA
jgi:hypothetical protein